MARKPDWQELHPLNPSVTAHTWRYLSILKRSGLHGSTESEVARILIQDQIKALIREGFLSMNLSMDEGDG